MRLQSVKAPATSWSARQVLGVVGGVVGGLSVLMAANRQWTDPRAALDGQLTIRPATAADVTVDAEALWRHYDENEVRADDRYRDKLLLVSGVVQSVEAGPAGGLRLNLRAPNEFLPIRAVLDGVERSRATQLDRGDQVRLRCRGAGLLVGRPILRECTFE